MAASGPLFKSESKEEKHPSPRLVNPDQEIKKNKHFPSFSQLKEQAAKDQSRFPQGKELTIEEYYLSYISWSSSRVQETKKHIAIFLRNIFNNFFPGEIVFSEEEYKQLTSIIEPDISNNFPFFENFGIDSDFWMNFKSQIFNTTVPREVLEDLIINKVNDLYLTLFDANGSIRSTAQKALQYQDKDLKKELPKTIIPIFNENLMGFINNKLGGAPPAQAFARQRIFDLVNILNKNNTENISALYQDLKIKIEKQIAFLQKHSPSAKSDMLRELSTSLAEVAETDRVIGIPFHLHNIELKATQEFKKLCLNKENEVEKNRLLIPVLLSKDVQYKTKLNEQKHPPENAPAAQILEDYEIVLANLYGEAKVGHDPRPTAREVATQAFRFRFFYTTVLKEIYLHKEAKNPDPIQEQINKQLEPFLTELQKITHENLEQNLERASTLIHDAQELYQSYKWYKIHQKICLQKKLIAGAEPPGSMWAIIQQRLEKALVPLRAEDITPQNLKETLQKAKDELKAAEDLYDNFSAYNKAFTEYKNTYRGVQQQLSQKTCVSHDQLILNQVTQNDSKLCAPSQITAQNLALQMEILRNATSFAKMSSTFCESYNRYFYAITSAITQIDKEEKPTAAQLFIKRQLTTDLTALNHKFKTLTSAALSPEMENIGASLLKAHRTYKSFKDYITCREIARLINNQLTSRFLKSEIIPKIEELEYLFSSQEEKFTENLWINNNTQLTIQRVNPALYESLQNYVNLQINLDKIRSAPPTTNAQQKIADELFAYDTRINQIFNAITRETQNEKLKEADRLLAEANAFYTNTLDLYNKENDLSWISGALKRSWVGRILLYSLSSLTILLASLGIYLASTTYSSRDPQTLTTIGEPLSHVVNAQHFVDLGAKFDSHGIAFGIGIPLLILGVAGILIYEKYFNKKGARVGFISNTFLVVSTLIGVAILTFHFLSKHALTNFAFGFTEFLKATIGTGWVPIFALTAVATTILAYFNYSGNYEIDLKLDVVNTAKKNAVATTTQLQKEKERSPTEEKKSAEAPHLDMGGIERALDAHLHPATPTPPSIPRTSTPPSTFGTLSRAASPDRISPPASPAFSAETFQPESDFPSSIVQ